jgi:hypothetical protein
MYKQLLVMLLLLVPALASTKPKPVSHPAKPRPSKDEAAEPDVSTVAHTNDLVTPDASSLMNLANGYHLAYANRRIAAFNTELKDTQLRVCGRVAKVWVTGDAITLKCVNDYAKDLDFDVFFRPRCTHLNALDLREGELVTLNVKISSISQLCIIFDAID